MIEMSYVPTQFGPNNGLSGFSSQASFINFWKKYAKQASGKLGIPYQWILAQWAMETAYGSQPNMGKFNPGNVGNLNGSWQNYSSPSAFVSAYVSAMQNDFPKLGKNGLSTLVPSGSARGGMAIPVLTPQQVLNGPNKYDPLNTTYGQNVANALPTVDQILGVPYHLSSPVGPGTTSSQKAGPINASKGIESAIGNVFTSPENFIKKYFVEGLILVGLMILIIILLYKGIVG